MFKFYCAIMVLLLAFPAVACTDFQIKAEDGSVIVGRSMEFALGIDSDIVAYPRVEKMTSMDADGKKGISWKPKYGYLGVDAFQETAAMMDGMNEAGLSAEFLWFTESQYNQATDNNWLAITDLGHWMLGNFATVDEVKKAISKVKVVGIYVPELKQAPGLHAAVHDAKGNSIVIEFIGGETKIYDNPTGVMTNKPTFDWHLTNLRNYVSLSPVDQGVKMIAGMKVDQAGSGSGWFGLPGDWTPPSRFIRTALMVHSADPVKDATGAINLAEHILNANDIPLGVVRSSNPGNKDLIDYTQWIVIKDLTNRILYFRSYQNLTLKSVDMKKLDLRLGAKTKTTPVNSANDAVIDVTAELL
ncbi:MAG: choloylglycine hydrolase family protein [Candidatus Margulisiibacteriota bacterium]